MPEVIIYSRPDCHLCNVVERIAKTVQAEHPFILTRINVDETSDLAIRYGERVPVVLIDLVEAFSGTVTEGEFRRAIERANRQGLRGVIRSFFRIFKKPVKS